MLFQLDSDILGEHSFSKYNLTNYKHTVKAPIEPAQRSQEIRTILSLAAQIAEMTVADVNRHVFAPAVESTETWCIAAFSAQANDFESLTGQNLIDEFMSALEITEGKAAAPPYAAINKAIKRREPFCNSLAGSSQRIVASCESFRQAQNQLQSIAKA